MDSPLVRFTTTDDGLRIAHWARGDGPLLVSLPALPHSHVVAEWAMPECRRFYEALASGHKLVRYDSRGTGLSERDVPTFSLEGFAFFTEAIFLAMLMPLFQFNQLIR